VSISLPVSERVIRAIVCRLKRIRRADGYCTDAGANVLRSRRSLDSVELPAINLWDQGESATKAGSKHAITLSVDVEGCVPADKDDTGEALEWIKADIKRAMFADGSDLVGDEAGQIGALTYTACVTTSRDDGGSVEIARLSFNLTYQEGLGNPNGQEAVNARRRI
jgi:hypothetical protein